MITDQLKVGEIRKFLGFLHDYDYSAMEPDDDDEPELEDSEPPDEPGEEDPTQTATAPEDPAQYKERTVGIPNSLCQDAA